MDPFFATILGQGPKRLLHWEHWSDPDAETSLTGIDHYAQPRQCRLRLKELYPQLNLAVPETDTPLPRPRLDGAAAAADGDRHTVRWGDAETDSWEHGETHFHSVEDVLRFSPLAKADFTDWPHVVMNWDFSSEEAIYQRLRPHFPAAWGDRAPAGENASTWFYNTLFMWPLLTFGWELFLQACLEDEFTRVMEEFAELNRRVFRAFARLPVNWVLCHDDIVNTRGPVCSPAWMRRHIFPRYEEYWGLLRAAGKQVVFMADGKVDDVADDVMACGARGIISEPYTDYKALARRHPDCFLAGEGDNRVLKRNRPDEIDAMVRAMVETGKMSRGYLLCIGNHIPWDIPGEAVKRYLDRAAEWGWRD